MADPKEALKLCIKAISENDTDSLYSAMQSTQLPVRDALNVAHQAWRLDVKNGSVGASMSNGGMLNAVYLGTISAQERAGLGGHSADNATTLVVSLAINTDDERLVNVIVSWDANFRVGERESNASVDSTVEFFLGAGAPKCAAKLMELKNELVLAPRNKFLEDEARARIVRNSKALLSKHDIHPLVKAAAEQLVQNDGDVSVVDSGGGGEISVFSVGLCMAGKSEVMTICTPKKLKKAHAKLNKLVTEAMRGDMKKLPSLDKFIKLGDGHLLTFLAAATTHLRPAEVPPVVIA